MTIVPRLCYSGGMQQYKTSWDMSLLYKGIKDPQIEKDVQTIENAFSSLEKKYKNGTFVKTPQSLLAALKVVEALLVTAQGSRPFVYFYFLTEINTEDTVARATLTKLEQRMTTAANKLAFFDLTIAGIPKGQQKKFLSFPGLREYSYLLQKIFETAQYNLSEKEEQLENTLSQPSFSMWIDATEKMLNKQTVLHTKERIPLSKAESILSSLPEKQRHALYNEILAAYKVCEPFAEAEINAIYTYKKLMDEKRGFKDSYSQSLLSYEIDEKDAFTLVDLVTKYNSISKKFYTLHAKLLGKKTISYADRSVQIGDIKKQFTFDKAVSLVSDAFEKVDKKYSQFLHQFLVQGQIDVFPRSGKRNGGYCVPTYGNPTFILLNHTEDLHSVETLAHEMGHAIHSELSKIQPAHYQQHSMPVAEVASTFFEQVLYESIVPTLSEKEQVLFLHSRLLRDVMTIFRQIACFQFEKDLHQAVRTQGTVASSDIKKMLAARFSSYMGNAVDVRLDDGLQYVGWSHIRSFFYVFSYAYGLLVSKSLFERWKADPSYIVQIETFLSAGGSMSPKDIFKKIGIDTSDPAFFEAGLKAIDADIKKLERLAKKAKMI